MAQVTRKERPFSFSSESEQTADCTAPAMKFYPERHCSVEFLYTLSLRDSARSLMLTGYFRRSILHRSVNSLIFSFIMSTALKAHITAFWVELGLPTCLSCACTSGELSGAGPWPSCSRWYPWHSAQGLAHSRHMLSICRMHE